MLVIRVERRRAARRMSVSLAFLLLTSVLLVNGPRLAEAAATTVEQCFLDKINDARADVGAAALAWAPAIEDYTRDHSIQMSEWGPEDWSGDYHSSGAALAAAIPAGWTSWGENIAYQSNANPNDCTPLHNAFMASDGHRSNVEDSGFEFVATGTHVDSAGHMWTTHVFFSNPSYVPGFNGTFSDDDNSTFEEDIEKIAAEGITTGCGGDLYCPNDPVSRAQMAAFLNRALDLPAGPDAGFNDVGGAFEADINAIAYAGITQGCQPSLYCPNASLSRAQMAAFLVRAFDLPPAPDAGFGDAVGHIFEDEINRLAAAGITLGCDGGTNFCPNDEVTRGQMAAFLSRALDL